jgi:hypothetical protein
MVLAKIQISLLSGGGRGWRDCANDIVAIVHADQGVNPRHRFHQGLPVTLDQTAGHDDPAAPAGLFALDRFGENFVSFRPGGLKESASVDDDYVGLGFIRGQHEAGLGELPEHLLRIDQILRTSQRDERNLWRS